MQRIRTEILPGVWLTALRTEKFKTAWLSVNLLTQLRRETAACTAVLPYVLRRGCTRLPDLEAIAAELDGLYGAHITPVVHKLGEIQAVGFEADFADDGALGEEIFPRLAADVADLLLHPNTRGGLLRPDIVDPLLIAYAVGGVLLSFALALGYTLLTEKLPERRGVMIQGMFRSNYVIMGIPVATALLGADQLGTVSILIAIIVPIFNMMSIIVLEVFRGQKPKPLHILGQIAKNPLVIASVLGVLALVAKIRLPYVLEKTVQSVSGIASPLQLFLLGAFFQFSGLRRYARELTAVVAAKLIVFPGLFLGLGALLGFRDAAFVSLLGVFASPTAVNSFTMAQQMGGDAELAGDTVVVTSAVSMLTMFLWVFLFKSLGMF